MAKNGQLFNSKSDPVPRVRLELNIIPIENNGRSFLYFHDQMGYATENLALDREAGMILSLLDGQKSVEDLSSYLAEGVTTDQLLEYIRFLDEHRLLYTPHFEQHADWVEEQYESTSVHLSVTAGTSYPADPDVLKTYLDEAFAAGPEADPHAVRNTGTIKALYAPHIDPRVGLESYVKAFSAIKHLKPKRVVILATSHYAGHYPDLYDNRPFILSGKEFELPLKELSADPVAIDGLADQPGELGISLQDRAHRLEHSIELHLLFLSYLWDHEYEIVPILVRGFDELFYMENGHMAKRIEQFGARMNGLFGRDEETFFLISGDLAHIGKKFGDTSPASEMFDEVKRFDRSFMNHAEKADREGLLQLVKDRYDRYRICGFAPLYTFLTAMPGVTGEVLSYDLWDETERESAVSFCSILFKE